MPAPGAVRPRPSGPLAVLVGLVLALTIAAPGLGAWSPPSPRPIPAGSPGASSAGPGPSASPGPTADPCAPVASPEPDASGRTQASPSASGSGQPVPASAPVAGPACASPGPSATSIPSPTSGPTIAPGPTGSQRPAAIRPGGIRAILDVPISRRLPCHEFPRTGCVNRVDIYHPRNAGSWPTVVTIHGRPRTPADMKELARALAARGAVVFNADYRGVRPVSKGFPEAIWDVACAIRFARANTARYGGDPDHIVLVGHSYGGYVGMMVAVAGNRLAGRGIGCLEDRGSSLPDGFVHVAGVSITKPSEPLDAIFFGGAYEDIPEVWRRGDVFRQIAIGGNRHLKTGIIFELDDPFLGYGHATWLRNELRSHGYDVRLVLLTDGHTHFDVLDMDTALGQRILRFTERVMRRTDPDRARGSGAAR